jgi:P27 family predicted phage terminase small subunit
MKTVAQHKADGTFRADRHGDYQPVEGEPAMPPGMLDEPAALFRDLAPKLAEAGGITPEDGEALGDLCNLIIETRDLRAFLATHGYTYQNTKGVEVKRPEVEILNAKLPHKIKLLQQFGMTPKGRVGLRSTKQAGDDLRDMLAARGDL